MVIFLCPRAQRPNKAAEVVAPLPAVLFAPAGVIPSHGLLPELLALVWVWLSVRAPLYEPVQLGLDQLSAHHVHALCSLRSTTNRCLRLAIIPRFGRGFIFYSVARE